ncbi:MAG: hypothetical protein IPJ71_02870 [Bdellovibrionales bacterium]|nr:hypothetical protein [Bdellovibrionales bacterium]
MFWEHYIDILATRLSAERAKEMGLKYELYSATEWFLKIYKSDYSDRIVDRIDVMRRFEKEYFDFVLQRRCVYHLVGAT